MKIGVVSWQTSPGVDTHIDVLKVCNNWRNWTQDQNLNPNRIPNMNNIDADYNPFPELTDEELDAVVNELPTPTPEAIALYNAKIEFLHTINKEVGVFQDVVVADETDEIKLANSGKYVIEYSMSSR